MKTRRRDDGGLWILSERTERLSICCNNNDHRNVSLVSKVRKSRHSQECKNPRRHCFFVPRDLSLWHFDPKINRFPGLMVEHYSVKFGDPSCIGFWNVVRKNRHRQTDKRRWKPCPRPPSAWVMSTITRGHRILKNGRIAPLLGLNNPFCCVHHSRDYQLLLFSEPGPFLLRISTPGMVYLQMIKLWSMPERFEIYIVHKWRYINTLPLLFLSLSNTWFLGPTPVSPQTASRSVQPFCRAHERDQQTGKHTDTQTTLLPL